MRVKLAALVITALALAVVLTACDNFAEYTVINQTDQELLTWPLLEDCGAVIGNNDDLLSPQVVKPYERHVYFDAYWGEDPECVQVVTRDRRLVLTEVYEYGGTYIVREPLQAYGDPVPERDDLPSPSFGQSFREGGWRLLVVGGLGLIFGLGVLAGFLFALFITVRFFYRHYRGTI